MSAIQTIYTFATNPGAGPAATAPAAGDSLAVSNFDMTQHKAYIEHAWRRGATAGFGRIRSPKLHDIATGINWNSGELVDTLVIPHEINQPVYPADILTAEVSGGGAESDALCASLYYEDFPGANAQLFAPGDIIGNIRNLKHFQVAAPAGANAWTDTAITVTENQLHANSDYAVLGMKASATVAAIAIRAPETGNLRVGMPGTTLGEDTADFFLRWSRLSQKPCIPVFNANNRAGVTVGAADVAAVAGLVVTLVCAELANPLTRPV